VTRPPTRTEELTSIGHNLYLKENDNLQSLTGLDNLVTINGSMSLFSGPDDFEGLESLATIGGSLTISPSYDDTCTITRLTGLENLREISTSLQISSCETITDLSALHSIDNLRGSLSIYDNDTLPTAEAESLRDAIGSIGGTITISNNGG